MDEKNGMSTREMQQVKFIIMIFVAFVAVLVAIAMKPEIVAIAMKPAT